MYRKINVLHKWTISKAGSSCQKNSIRRLTMNITLKFNKISKNVNKTKKVWQCFTFLHPSEVYLESDPLLSKITLNEFIQSKTYELIYERSVV